MRLALRLVAGLLLLSGCSASSQTADNTPAAGAGSKAQTSTHGPRPAAESNVVETGAPRQSAAPDRFKPAPSATLSGLQPVRAFPIRGCKATYGRTHHDYPASDIFAASGCDVVSVTDGVVDEVSRKDVWTAEVNDGAARGGLSISVVGTDGVRYYYSHLSRIDAEVSPGATVRSGQRLGDVGDTGSAQGTSPHLHFGLSWPTSKGAWWVRRGVLPPAPYLDAWKAGTNSSPVKAITGLRRSKGELPKCQAAC